MTSSGQVILILSAACAATALFIARPVTPSSEVMAESTIQRPLGVDSQSTPPILDVSIAGDETILGQSPFAPGRRAFTRDLPAPTPEPVAPTQIQRESAVEILGFLDAPSGRSVLLRVQGTTDSVRARQGDITPFGTVIEIGRTTVVIERTSGARQTLTQY